MLIIRINSDYFLLGYIRMIEVLPGILEKEWGEIEKKIELVKPFAKAIHVDLLDGKFAPNTTFFDPAPFKKYSQDIFFELHMMTEEPEQYIKPFADCGFRRFLGHIEKMSDQTSFVATAQNYGEVGLAIDGPTPIADLKVPLIDLDALLIMSIKAGFSGQAFVLDYVSKIKKLKDELLIPIEVDGGINQKTIKEAISCGATRFVATSALFDSGNPQQDYQTLLSVA